MTADGFHVRHFALLSDDGTYVLGIAQFLLAGGVAAGIAVVAASGDGTRPHGPLCTFYPLQPELTSWGALLWLPVATTQR